MGGGGWRGVRGSNSQKLFMRTGKGGGGVGGNSQTPFMRMGGGGGCMWR